MNHSLARRLKSETAALHAEVEQSGVMGMLLRGHLCGARYCALLANLHAIYVALESALTRHATHVVVAPVCFPVLFRAHSLAADLQDLCDDWQQAPALAAATRRYVLRLQWLEQAAPARLAAHAYVRYLGDLHGGQVLARIVARSLALDGEQGTRFYRFGDTAQVHELRRRFRAGLDAIPADEHTAHALVEEAKTAFELHGEMFRELAEEAIPANASDPA